jgi:septum formation protein
MIFLASKSPRRQSLLKQINVTFELVSAQIDESQQPNEKAEDYVIRLALEKARAGLNLLDDSQKIVPVLGSDTVVVLDNHILGKPRGEAHAIEMLQQLSGRTHQVMTGVALLNQHHEKTALSTSEVTFREISLLEIEQYWQTGEPADKAGAYAIQGAAAVFIEHLSGSYSGVMGLPLYETAQLLQFFQE